MALGADFITLPELRTYMKIVPDEFDDVLEDAISSATIEIIRHCHRDFNDAGSVSTREYEPFLHPDFGPMVITDDFHTTTGLIVASDGTTFDNADLTLKPLNGVMQGLTGWPYWKIEGDFTLSEKVSVTAQWGWSAIPKPVRQAAFILATDTFQLKDQRLGIAGSDAFGSVITVKDSKAAQSKLRSYRRDSVLVDG